MDDSLNKLLKGTTHEADEGPMQTSGEPQVNNRDDANLLRAYRKLKKRSNTEDDELSDRDQLKLMTIQDALRDVTLPSGLSGLREQLMSVAKGDKVIQPAPPSVIASKHMRVASYKQVVKDMDKWEPVLNAQNAQKHISFFNKTRPSYPIGNNFQPSDEFEKKLCGIIDNDVNSLDKDGAKLSVAEKRAFRKMSLEEAKQRRRELKKYTLLLSKEEAKYRREKRIKSKNFHKMKRIENMKKSSKETNLNVSEEMRAKERFTLKHSKGSKWINRMNKLNFRDNNMKQTLNKQHQISKQLKKHPIQYASDADDADATNAPEQEEVFHANSNTYTRHANPWLNKTDTPLLLNNTTTLEKADVSSITRDPFLSNGITFNKEDIDEAFADDDVAEEFFKEQLDSEETANNIAIDDNTELPGWGKWTGGAVLEKTINRKLKEKSEHLRKKLSDLKRKPRFVIINPENRDKLLKHQVRQLPYPYKSKAQFEHVLRRPVGREWNTELSRMSAIKPKIEVAAGTIIQPNKYVAQEDTNASLKIIKSNLRKNKLKTK